MIRYSIQVSLLLLVLFLAIRKGGQPERHVAIILATMHLANLAYFLILGLWVDYHGSALFRVLLDVAALIAFCAIALRADRWWPLWVSSAQLLAVMAHLLRAIDTNLPLTVWSMMERWPFWAAIVLTGLGTMSYSQRMRGRAIAY